MSKIMRVFSDIARLLNEVVFELGNVKWPTQKELGVYGLIVFVVVLVSSVMLSVMDFGFGYLVQALLVW